MLKPIASPLACYGLEHDRASKICAECAHRLGCQELTGYRLNRVALDSANFDLIPETIQYRTAEREVDERDIEAIYAESYRQVFGTDPRGSVGKFKQQVIQHAEEVHCSLPMFMLACMFAHSQTSSKEFTSGILADGRAMGRVNMWADACRAKYASFDVTSMAKLAGVELAQFDLKRRMLDSEVQAGTWIINFKLWHPGPPYPGVFDAVEKDLDHNWLAIEPHYEATLIAYSKRQDAAGDAQTRHETLKTFARLKKHKHQAISNFRARERIMGEAIRKVLGEHGYSPQDFEVERKPIHDALTFWSRLGLAIQHMECLKFVQLHEGVYRR